MTTKYELPDEETLARCLAMLRAVIVCARFRAYAWDPQLEELLDAVENVPEYMLGSCQGTDATPQVPAHCGQARGNVLLPVTPFMPDCGAYFSYGSDGSIDATSDPATKEAAGQTIRILRLGVDRLKSARAAAIEGAIEGLDGLSADEPERPDCARKSDSIRAFTDSGLQITLRRATSR